MLRKLTEISGGGKTEGQKETLEKRRDQQDKKRQWKTGEINRTKRDNGKQETYSEQDESLVGTATG
jgi:hypothetical protein